MATDTLKNLTAHQTEWVIGSGCAGLVAGFLAGRLFRNWRLRTVRRSVKELKDRVDKMVRAANEQSQTRLLEIRAAADEDARTARQQLEASQEGRERIKAKHAARIKELQDQAAEKTKALRDATAAQVVGYENELAADFNPKPVERKIDFPPYKRLKDAGWLDGEGRPLRVTDTFIGRQQESEYHSYAQFKQGLSTGDRRTWDLIEGELETDQVEDIYNQLKDLPPDEIHEKLERLAAMVRAL
jgi:hypothetical protein